MDISVIGMQNVIAKALNKELPEEWGAFKATTRDGDEYVEVCKADGDRGERYIITIQKAWE